MRKMGKKMIAAIALLVMMCGGAAGCGVKNASVNKEESYYPQEMADGFDYETEAVSGDEYNEVQQRGSFAKDAEYDEVQQTDSVAENAEEKVLEDDAQYSKVEKASSEIKQNKAQKIIKRYNCRYKTEKFDDAYAYLKERVAEYDGYITSSEVEGTEYRKLRLTARIPADTSDEFVGNLGALGTVVSQSETAEDVTLQYSDTESRIESLKVEQQRLNDLLKQADSLDTIIALEERLTDVRYELENYQSRKNLYDDLITYSTVQITLDEVIYTVPVDDSSVLSRIVSGLELTFHDILYDLENFVVWFVVSLPYIIIWGIVILIIVKMARKIIRKKRNKKKIKENISTEETILEKEKTIQKEDVK